MRELHLFAGIGGGILGGMLLGHTPVCAVELEEYPRRVLLQRQREGILPKFPIWDDVRTFNGTDWRGKVDVICGGFPCQDISSAGKKAGIKGTQSSLWKEFARIIREVGPRYVFVENSPMLTRRGLGDVLRDLAQMGYDAEWGVLGAKHVGAKHRRMRVWILAHPKRDEQSRKEPCSRPLGRMGGKQQSMARNTDWEEVLSRVRGASHGVPNRVDRTDGIRNAQVPAVARLAWGILKDLEHIDAIQSRCKCDPLPEQESATMVTEP